MTSLFAPQFNYMAPYALDPLHADVNKVNLRLPDRTPKDPTENPAPEPTSAPKNVGEGRGVGRGVSEPANRGLANIRNASIGSGVGLSAGAAGALPTVGAADTSQKLWQMPEGGTPKEISNPQPSTVGGGFWSHLGHDLVTPGASWSDFGHTLGQGLHDINGALNNRYVKDVMNFGSIPGEQGVQSPNPQVQSASPSGRGASWLNEVPRQAQTVKAPSGIWGELGSVAEDIPSFLGL